ncbi:hypothetical protein [Candidatus Thiodictyon syntrophicum]|jgi:hypothetical protein|uniref:Uncharacterized protein n=1 Tax=Candidatus Thiodictyon syntrophicum TaxID=1166950 RepID=A0A2K8U7C4_9GAMM|nr:hypothetical protein [Candidatus Thiodictyon syntrophicum]AUB81454.1 hypothetical protein THSYN_11145 [Candidatus Thiodictyon syntrophicum]
MALTLASTATSLTLPGNLLWADELAWEPRQQAVTWALDGVVWVFDGPARTGRPITYRGGADWVRLSRTDLLALLALGALGTALTLNHHDGRTFRVLPRRENGESWVRSAPWPVVGDSGAANPSGTAWYVLEEIRLIEVPV